MSAELREQIQREEFDYPMLMSALSGYASPRDRVTVLLRNNIIQRVKKGLYVFGDAYRRAPYCKELLANLISGPSCVSLEYALSFYTLIPERVEEVTSVTTGRAKRFDTPIGVFSYRPTTTLSVGVELSGSGNSRFLMALPERALADKIRDDRGCRIRSRRDLAVYLAEDLRIEPSDLQSFSVPMLEELADLFASKKIHFCAEFIRQFRRT